LSFSDCAGDPVGKTGTCRSIWLLPGQFFITRVLHEIPTTRMIPRQNTEAFYGIFFLHVKNKGQ